VLIDVIDPVVNPVVRPLFMTASPIVGAWTVVHGHADCRGSSRRVTLRARGRDAPTSTFARAQRDEVAGEVADDVAGRARAVRCR
jgi:hypothetical protein